MVRRRPNYPQLNLDDFETLSAWYRGYRKLLADNRPTLRREAVPPPSLRRVLRILSGESLSDPDLLAILSFCRYCEFIYLERLRSEGLAPILTLTIDGESFRAVSIHSVYFAANPTGRAGRSYFLTGKQFAFELSVAWVATTGFSIDVRNSPVLGISHENEGDEVRIGAVKSPFATDEHWCYLDTPIESRKSARVTGYQHGEESIVRAFECAADAGCEVIVFPELTVTPVALSALRSRLAQGSPKWRVRIVVAGSWHLVEGSDTAHFRNRATVLGPHGDVAWVQDKLEPFFCRHNGKEITEPTIGSRDVFVREGSRLGRVTVSICSDFCNLIGIPHFLQQVFPSLVCVPTMQVIGSSEVFGAQAIVLAKQTHATSVVANVRVDGRESTQGDTASGQRLEPFVRTPLGEAGKLARERERDDEFEVLVFRVYRREHSV